MNQWSTKLSLVGSSKPTLVSSRRTEIYGGQEAFFASPDRTVTANIEAISQYFMGLWQAPSALRALDVLYQLEIKRELKSLHERFGHWCPPPEVADVLKRPPPVRPNLPDTKEARNLRFVIKMLGCSLHENRPYKEFLKAKTIRQKRLWMYRFMPMKFNEIEEYCEPICPTRMKRLYHFFPGRFREEDGCVYFNHKEISYDRRKRIYYIGKTPDDDE